MSSSPEHRYEVRVSWTGETRSYDSYSRAHRIEIDGKRGIVQEVDVLVTRIESDDEEFVVPNRIVVRHGVVRIRE